MASVNKAIIVGNLGRDPETRYSANGEAITNINVATTDTWKDKATGEKKEAVEWHRISFFGKLAEIAGQYLKKGSQVYVEGSLRTRKYTDKDGVEKYATDIRADTLQMLGNKQSDALQSSPAPRDQAPEDNRSRQQRNTANARSSAPDFSDMDDDIPFLFNLNAICDTMGLSKSIHRSKYGKNGKRMHLLQANQADF